MSNLNPDQFFHGTTYPITDVVRPANDVDKNVSEYSMGDPGTMSEGDHAFSIRNHEGYAWHAANTFHRNGRRPRVYEVEPADDMVPGPWNKDHPDFLYHNDLEDPKDYDEPAHDSDDRPVWEGMVDEAENARQFRSQDEWASPTGFPVKKRIDIMPGRQGTFPEFNWNRFKDGGARSQMGYDTNHPSDAQVKYGTQLDSAPDHPMVDAMRNEHDNPEPKRRSGRSLRAFMEGKPDPGPFADHPTLF